MASIPDIFRALNRDEVRYLLIGGYASVIHGVPRTTVDIDIAVDPDPDNVRRALESLRQVGLVPELDHVDDILGQGGVTATDDRDVDLITSTKGATFDELWPGRMVVVFRNTEIRVVSRQDQIRLLRASGRPQDLEDAELLESLEFER